MRRPLIILTILSLLFTSSAAAAAAPGETLAFSTSGIFESAGDFESAREFWGLGHQVAALEDGLDEPDKLLGALALLSGGNNTFEKLYAYAYLAYAANQRDSGAQERYRSLKSSAARFESLTAPLRTQLTSLPASYLAKCRDDRRFSEYTPVLDALIAAREHGGGASAGSETLRELTPALAFPAEVASIVLNADLNPGMVTRPDGQSVPATSAELARAMSGGDARYRREAYEQYYTALNAHRNTLAASLEAHVSGRVRQAALRQPGGGSSHEAQTVYGRYELPPAAADTLLEAVGGTLPIYHRGAELKAGALGQETIRPYEITVPDGAGAGTYTYEQAAGLVLEALSPLGQEYTDHARRILYGGHVNFEQNAGKQSGAFCMSAGPDTDPYIHINFDGSLVSVSTLAHELGHAVHMVLARSSQPDASAQPALAATETAAILNEILLMRHLLRQAGDASDIKRAATAYSDLIGSTLYQQTRYFTFERAVYQLVENGGVLTADKGDELWEAVSAPYRSAALSVPEIASGAWAGIPHLYRDFYVLNYSFSVTAAETFADALEDGGPGTVLEFLKAGGSKPAYQLFCERGVDFLDKKSYNDVVNRLDGLYNILKGLDTPARAA